MRWEELFEDLESQAEAAGRDEEAAVAGELTTAEEGTVLLADRLRAAVGRRVTLGGREGSHTGVVIDASRAWVVLVDGVRHVLVPLRALTWVEGVDRVAGEPGGSESRLGLAHPLRALSEREVPVRVTTPGRTLTGVISRVGRDHLQLDAGAGGSAVAISYRAVDSVSW